jgi:hypothetical protein
MVLLFFGFMPAQITHRIRKIKFAPEITAKQAQTHTTHTTLQTRQKYPPFWMGIKSRGFFETQTKKTMELTNP